MAFLNPPSAPLFQRGERGDFCGYLAQKGEVEKKGGFIQKAKVLSKNKFLKPETRNPQPETFFKA
jgi:hypothetical protein